MPRLPDVVIRAVRPDDADAIVRILNPIIQAGIYTVLDTLFTTEEEREYILRYPARGIFHVAEMRSSGRIVGFESMEPFSSDTHAFDHVGVIGTFVDLGELRQGIGTRLSQTMFAVARTKGYEKIFTYVRSDNQASLNFHLKLGFRIIGTALRQAHIGQRYVDEVFIEKFLSK